MYRHRLLLILRCVARSSSDSQSSSSVSTRSSTLTQQQDLVAHTLQQTHLLAYRQVETTRSSGRTWLHVVASATLVGRACRTQPQTRPVLTLDQRPPLCCVAVVCVRMRCTRVCQDRLRTSSGTTKTPKQTIDLDELDELPHRVGSLLAPRHQSTRTK